MLELGYFTWIFPLIKPFCGYHNFWPCNHDLGVWHTFKNCNLANKFWTVSARALIFKMNIPCDKTFPWAPLFFFILWHSPWSLTHFLKILTLLIIFEQWMLELWFFTWIFPVIRPVWGYHHFSHCDLDLGVKPIFKKIL